jgi:hypothetical protein
MVMFRREIRLWRETGATQRALMIRDDADTYWLACQMQHGRITDPGPVILSDPRSSLIQRRIDVDLFIVSLHRLHTVGSLAAEVADPRSVLPGALDRFRGLTAGLPLSEGEPGQPTTIASVRNAFEHWQNLTNRGRLGLASGPEGWWISYRDRMFETKDLLAAAQDLHVPRGPSPGPGGPAPRSPTGRPRRWRGCKPTCPTMPTAPSRYARVQAAQRYLRRDLRLSSVRSPGRRSISPIIR